jgi:hypothetical protein
MKHKIVALSVLVLIAGFLVFAGTSFSAQPPKATGGVEITLEGAKLWVEFTAHAGDPAKGMLHLQAKDNERFWYKLDVECVNVVGKMAFFSGTIVKASDEIYVGQCRKWVVYDGGTPGSEGDWISWDVGCTDPKDCQPFDPAFKLFVEKGNLVVHYAP